MRVFAKDPASFGPSQLKDVENWIAEEEEDTAIVARFFVFVKDDILSGLNLLMLAIELRFIKISMSFTFFRCKLLRGKDATYPDESPSQYLDSDLRYDLVHIETELVRAQVAPFVEQMKVFEDLLRELEARFPQDIYELENANDRIMQSAERVAQTLRNVIATASEDYATAVGRVVLS